MTGRGIVIVDWLGRGGIAQTAEAWAMELADAGHEVTVVTRPDRELTGDGYELHAAGGGRGRLRAHAQLVRSAATLIGQRSPGLVVVHSSLVPRLERRVLRAAADAGARTTLVVHNHRPHSRWAGTGWGFGWLLRSASTVVTHSEYVAERLPATVPDVRVIPHPVQTGMLRAAAEPSPVPAGGERLALHFGLVSRGYKATDVVTALAGDGVAGWRFAVVGRGARPSAGIEAVDRFVSAGELMAAVRASAATLLPYRRATQSGAVVLAQLARSVPVASAVGGLPEQIRDGDTGILVPPDSGTDAWRAALERLDDEGERQAIADRAHRAVWAGHRQFVDEIRRLAADT